MDLRIFIGLQASGKSTFFRTYFAATHQLVSKDCFRNNKHPSKRQVYLIEAALQAGHSVVVDNTNPTVADRAAIIEIGKAYDLEIIGYYFQSQISECLQRNQQRTGKARVPDIAIYATQKKLELPSFAEGFNRLYAVQIANNAAFVVCEWTEVKNSDG